MKKDSLDIDTRLYEKIPKRGSRVIDRTMYRVA
jgi:hypothetical protein